MNTTTSIIKIPTTISTTERIFQIKTVEGEMILCNLDTAVKLIHLKLTKSIKHYWNHSFAVISKRDVLDMH